ncbi:MAG: hypothetical protein JXA82_09675 [Sedimentisphaerales bacterium]|nr:hypothetical protein [Sedimentisphaerales bacterium]
MEKKWLNIVLILVWMLAFFMVPRAIANPYGQWRNGPPKSNDFFPIAVWLQDPRKAQQYQQAGINTYVGLWKGPTEIQLAQLKAAGMKLICVPNEVGLQHRDDPTIIGWMHGDEPDNTQARKDGQGYGPPIPPSKITSDYEHIRDVDPSRPILLNLGQGVAYDNWIGRGVRRNHPEDYPLYIQGCDIVSFDIYPVVHRNPDVAGKLWFVPKGVQRLKEWSNGTKVVWNCIECTRIQSKTARPTPHEVRCEVWMSLIHGSRGLIYFVHEWEPRFNESALLDDSDMLAGVTKINQQVHALAPILNRPSQEEKIFLTSSNPSVPIAFIAKASDKELYLFTVAMRPEKTQMTVTLRVQSDKTSVEVLGEQRMLPVHDGSFVDHFDVWDVHLYRIYQEE